MRKTIWWLIFIAGLVLLAAIPYYASLRQQGEKSEPAQPADIPVADAEPRARAEPAGPRHPLSLPPLEKPLPALDTSDATLRNTARELWGDKAVEERFRFKDFIRRVVATVDNLPRRKLPQQMMPVRRVEGAFLVTGDDSGYAVSPDNAKRYAPYVALAESVSPAQLVSLYVKLYPLFQQAYEDLGYPGQYFNDRLIAAIDDLLAAQQPDASPGLLRPKVFYVYADPELEHASAGQKILMRMGADNAARVKSQLRAIRTELERRTATLSQAR